MEKNLYKISVKDGQDRYECYDEFIVAADSIPEALEVIYQNYTDHNYIPFYLRSSNLNIKTIGKLTFDNTKEFESYPVLSTVYYGG